MGVRTSIIRGEELAGTSGAEGAEEALERVMHFDAGGVAEISRG